jgi:hypothetical protein
MECGPVRVLRCRGASSVDPLRTRGACHGGRQTRAGGYSGRYGHVHAGAYSYQYPNFQVECDVNNAAQCDTYGNRYFASDKYANTAPKRNSDKHVGANSDAHANSGGK